MLINDLRNENELINVFCDLVEIPSPSKEEHKVIDWIKVFCKEYDLNYSLDDYKNVYISIPATNQNNKPILLSAHMDVVGDFSPVNITVDNNFIKTDGTRTLGADDKAGVACALMFAKFLKENPIKHGGLEIIFTRDEEHGMSGIKHVDFNKIQSKYAFVLDADKLGQILVSGASYTNALLKVETTYGGHSGLDIGDEKRLNAAKLITELVVKIPQGVFYSDETGTITSINLGTIIGGNIQNIVTGVLNNKVVCDDYLQYFMENSVTNVINTEAQVSYSIRSASIEKEDELKKIIQNEVDEFNKKYAGLAKSEFIFYCHLPPFEKSEDILIESIHTAACNKLGIKQSISSFHAGAETHIYSQNTNSKGEKIIPFLIGMSDVFNMHSKDEKVDYKTLLKGFELLKEMFIEFNK